MIDLFAELRLIVGALDADDIDYALCGGVALAIHGIPRATLDVDLLVRVAEVDRARRALDSLGYRLTGADMNFAGGAVIISRLVKPDPDSEDALIVDLLHATRPLEQVWDGRQRLPWEHGSISTVSRDGLIALKRLRGSGQDQDDINKLRSVT
ncbi:MAG: hypothetical protein OXJ90_19425 [Spirochaetaceae bacterium]|nr:hypothetical protein [Spirochaetaceae bacterium]